MTIRKRLALWYSGLLTLLIVIFSVAVITVSRLTLLQTIDQVLVAAANNIAQNIEYVPIRGSETHAGLEILFHSDEVFRVPSISVQVWRTYEQGIAIEPILERASADIGDMTMPLDPSLIHAEKRLMNSTVINTVAERVVALPFHTPDGQALGLIMVATPLRAVSAANDQLLVVTLISGAIVIAVSIALGLWLSKHLLKPIGAIKEAAASISKAQDLSTRLHWTGAKDELGELSEVFNHMMERLETLFRVQQRFIGDVSHELRTPLTSIIGNLEIMDRYGVDEESLDAVQREASRMSRMVNDLLLLTRADFGELAVDMYPIDLDTIALEVYEQTLVLAKNRQLKISLERLEAVKIHGNADRLRQLMLNLISNAIKFTPDGGKINLSVYPEKDAAIIKICDTGIGISEADQQHIFDRFFQADAARVHHNEHDGAGLGLSIVRWIVDSHKGLIDVKSKLAEGTCFTVSLPLSDKLAQKQANPSQKALAASKSR